jgi:hypothetical protein
MVPADAAGAIWSASRTGSVTSNVREHPTVHERLGVGSVKSTSVTDEG